MVKKLYRIFKNPLIIFNFLSKIGFFKNMNDRKYLTIFFKGATGENLNLNSPVTFNQKIQWLKLNDRNPLYEKLVDKYKVREYVKNKIGEKYLIPLYQVWESPKDIDISHCKDKCVIKCNHDSGSAIIFDDFNKLSNKKLIKKISKYFNKNYFYHGREWPYKNINKKIICEKLLIDNSKKLYDYKIFCFSGEPKIIQVDIDRFSNHTRNLYDIEWNKIEMEIFYKSSASKINKPVLLEEMLSISRVLSKDIPFVRVDLYEAENKIYFGELTFYPGSGQEEIRPNIFDSVLGSWINLPDIR